MINFNKDIIFLYKFDSREPMVKYGKIRFSHLQTNNEKLINHIKGIIIDVINNSGKIWEIEYSDINLSIISIINRDDLLDNYDQEENDYSIEYDIYSIYIDIRNNNSLYYYENEKVEFM
jgi:hypothetical protein